MRFNIILAVIVFILLHFLLPTTILAAISDNFNKLAIGIAALVTAYFGGRYFIEKRTIQQQIDLYRKKYPADKYHIEWKIIVREDRYGEPHVLDIETEVKHHIWNMKTIYDLGWQFCEREPVKIKKFNNYLTGENIRTRGELGE